MPFSLISYYVGACGGEDDVAGTTTRHIIGEALFHFDWLSPGQRDIIEQLIQGKRILAIQRTGWGKSLCYQMASLFHPHLTLVFSSLNALMRDQCQRGYCAKSHFPVIAPPERIPEEVMHFLKCEREPKLSTHNIMTVQGTIQGISHRACMVLHCNDGYSYTKGAAASPPSAP